MVAYNFKRAFVDDIRAGTKRQTIRLPRRRHARPGEIVQLFVGMRTRHCARIIPDPLCIGVDEIEFDLRNGANEPRLSVNGIPLNREEEDLYARGDGFPGLPGGKRLGKDIFTARRWSPFEHMVMWWLGVHGMTIFHGVAIRWEPTR